MSDYILTPIMDRPYHPDYEWFKPSGLIGHGLGIIGSLNMIFGVSIYYLRKRLKLLQHVGRLSTWLRIHIFLCTLGPFYVLLHTTLIVNGIVSISFWSMVIVVLSGFFGRFLYNRIPKSDNGIFLSTSTIQQKISQLETKIIGHTNESVLKEIKLPQFELLLEALLFSLRIKTVKKQIIANVCQACGDEILQNKEINLRGLIDDFLQAQFTLSVRKPFQSYFNYWHVFHLPLAGLMFLIMFVHIVIAVLFGYTWIL
ncbi:hypothetical protein EP331_11825 [bacterium]|nr:MAG: hypothetical protein EP331_11825 [bacterium]